MVDITGYPIPTDPAEIARRLEAVERVFAMTASSRSLTQAAIGGGGLRVHDGGSIRIEGTGSLIVETGDLVLGAGAIDGAALKEQVETGFFTASSTTFAVSTNWGTATTRSITPPSWATRTVVSAQATVTLPTVGSVRGYLTGAGNTLDVNTFSRNFGEDTNTVASIAWGGVVNGSSAFTVSVDGRLNFSGGTTPKRADLQVSCIFIR